MNEHSGLYGLKSADKVRGQLHGVAPRSSKYSLIWLSMLKRRRHVGPEQLASGCQTLLVASPSLFTERPTHFVNMGVLNQK